MSYSQLTYITRCMYRFSMYAAHALYIRPPYAIKSPRLLGMYAVHTPLAPWIRKGQVGIRYIIRSGIAIHMPYALHVRHPCAVDTQHMRNSSARDVPPNHPGNLTAYLFIFTYDVRVLWQRWPVEQGHNHRIGMDWICLTMTHIPQDMLAALHK